MANQTLKGIPRLAAALRNSKAGLRDIWGAEEAFRLEIYGLIVSVPLAFWIGSSTFVACALIASVIFVVIVEVFNSAIEAVVDRIGSERHELSRIAKDLGSLAVLLSTLVPLLLWTGALYERFLG